LTNPIGLFSITKKDRWKEREERKMHFRARFNIYLTVFFGLYITLFGYFSPVIAESSNSTEQLATDSPYLTDVSTASANIVSSDFTDALLPPTMSPARNRSNVLQTGSNQNLALFASASASSYWPSAVAGRTFIPTPDRANNGDLADDWVSRYWIRDSWFRLDWAVPVKIGRILVTHATGEYNRIQTISSIRFWNMQTSQWETIPGSSFTYGGTPGNAFIDFEFSEITTNAILLSMYTNSHPNLVVFINEIEVYQGLEVLSVSAVPQTLWVDKNSAGSGLVFEAETSDEAVVSFKVIAPTGAEMTVGSCSTTNKNARLSWWGYPGPFRLVALSAEQWQFPLE
jgi:hypothetical protein